MLGKIKRKKILLVMLVLFLVLLSCFLIFLKYEERLKVTSNQTITTAPNQRNESEGPGDVVIIGKSGRILPT